MWGVGFGVHSMNPMKEKSYHGTKHSLRVIKKTQPNSSNKQTNEQDFTHQNLKSIQSSSSPPIAIYFSSPPKKKNRTEFLDYTPPNSIFLSNLPTFTFSISMSLRSGSSSSKFFSTFSNSSESKKSSSSLIS